MAGDTAKGGRGVRGKTHVKIGVSIPIELNDWLERLAGPKSQHIARALQHYAKSYAKVDASQATPKRHD